MSDPIDYKELNRLIDAAFPGRSFLGNCEAFIYQGTRLSNGGAKLASYPSAKAAYDASTINNRDINNVPVGDVAFWDKTSYWHDMFSIGHGRFLGATGLGDTVVDLGGGVKILNGSTYPAKFLGSTPRVGSRPHALLLPYDPPVIVLPGANAPTGGTALTVPLAGKGWNFAPPSKVIQKRIQVALRKRGRYKGLENGVFGSLSVAGIQKTVENVGYQKGYTPGVPGALLCHFIQVYAERFGGFKGLKPGGGAIPGILGPNAWLGFVRGLEAGLK